MSKIKLKVSRATIFTGQEIITVDSFFSCIAIVAWQGNKKARVLSFVVIYRSVQVGDVYERAIHSALRPFWIFQDRLDPFTTRSSHCVEPAQLERAIIDLFRMPGRRWIMLQMLRITDEIRRMYCRYDIGKRYNLPLGTAIILWPLHWGLTLGWQRAKAT